MTREKRFEKRKPKKKLRNGPANVQFQLEMSGNVKEMQMKAIIAYI